MSDQNTPAYFYVNKLPDNYSMGVANTFLLFSDSWDDNFQYNTRHQVFFIHGGERQHIGTIKIGEIGLNPQEEPEPGIELPLGYRKPNIPEHFEKLGDKFFSLGQDEDYYMALNELGVELRKQVLESLRDVAYDESLWSNVKSEYVMERSLLRDIKPNTVSGQFNRMAHGGKRIESYDFSLETPIKLGGSWLQSDLDFTVNIESDIPTNIHGIIGRNGVGKTQLLSSIVKSFFKEDFKGEDVSSIKMYKTSEGTGGDLVNLVAVSFSAFDSMSSLEDNISEDNEEYFSFIGLPRKANKKLQRNNTRKPSKPRESWSSLSSAVQGNNVEKSSKPGEPLEDLAAYFIESLRACKNSTAREERWKKIVPILEADPLFEEANLISLIGQNLSEGSEDSENVMTIYKQLSSGHKIVLLTLTKLVEEVGEKTLILIDEPETHLHPPLLSSMIRAMSELLIYRNGVAIITTHSPIVLQEIPKSCVYVLDRAGDQIEAERPEIETFAESVVVLTRDVFGLELFKSGYHSILRSLLQDERALVDNSFLTGIANQLGAEGRAILYSMLSNPNRDIS